MLENISNGKALNKFIELVETQEGDSSYIKDVNKFPKAKYIEEIKSPKNGYIYEINAEDIGKLACSLGAGRIKMDDIIEPEVGIVLNKKVSDKVEEEETLAYIHANDAEKLEVAKQSLLEIIKIGDIKIDKEDTIFEII